MGVRFFKSGDVVNVARQVVEQHAKIVGRPMAVRWVNDPRDLMTRSFPP